MGKMLDKNYGKRKKVKEELSHPGSKMSIGRTNELNLKSQGIFSANSRQNPSHTGASLFRKKKQLNENNRNTKLFYIILHYHTVSFFATMHECDESF